MLLEDDVLLPLTKNDRPLMLPTAAVLREQTGPVLRVARQVGATRSWKAPDAAIWHDGSNGVGALSSDVRIVVAHRDAEPKNVPAMAGETAVAQVHAEEIGVHDLVNALNVWAVPAEDVVAVDATRSHR